MLARLTLFALVIGVGLASTSVPDTAEKFDQETLRLNAASLTRGSPELFSANELHAMQSAVATGRFSDIDAILSRKAQIEIVINPEGRVAARRTGAKLAKNQCGLASIWLLRIWNTGYVTAPLTVSLVGETRVDARGSKAIELSLARRKLTGAEIEYQAMRIVVNGPGQHDATLVFAVESPDVGARAELPVLITCGSSPGG